jgi:N-acetylmuramic acid 6-phosphate etherase
MRNGVHGCFLGIEGGATRSTLVLADAAGNALVELQGGPANIRLLSDRGLASLLRGFAKRLPQCSVSGLCIGLAGARTEGDLERIEQAAHRVWPDVAAYATNDLETALAACPSVAGVAARVLVLAGTGSCCFGRSAQNKLARVGGRGHVVGDRGSACDISQRALKAVMAEYDHSGRWPRLGGRILRTLLLNDAEDLIPWSMQADKTEIASLAVCVFESAAARDELAKSLLTEAAQALADDADACAHRLARRSERVQFVMNGGVLLKNRAFARDVARRVRRLWPRAIFSMVEGVSAWGAVRIAIDRALQGADSRRPSKVPVSSKIALDAGVGPAADRGAALTLEPSYGGLLPEAERLNDFLNQSPTEQRNPRSMKLDRMSLRAAVDLMLVEDMGVPVSLRSERSSIEWVVRRILGAFKAGGRLFYVGAGTSGRLGVLDASECPPTFRAEQEQVQGIIAGGRRALWTAVEGAEDDDAAGASSIAHRGVNRRDVVVGIAASGRTPFVWGALDEASRRGAVTVLICFNPALKRMRSGSGSFVPDKIIATNLGPEVLTGSTRLKCGTATKLLLNIFTTLSLAKSGKVIGNLMVDLNPSNQKLRSRAVQIVCELSGCDEVRARAALKKAGWVVKHAVRLLGRR